MLRKISVFVCFIAASVAAGAQQTNLYESYHQEGEFGAAIGLAHYFGDLNTRAAVNRPKFSGGIFLSSSLIIT